ncbi:MAG: hypothetical protein JXR37_24070 [Kiritimatiellae bacterium]|nr:hypothetical protein [Kiritimatiellia bacterium]
MKRGAMCRLLAFVVGGGCLVQPAEAAPQEADGAAVARQCRELSRDIPSLYLINGLFLSPEQIGAMLPLLEQARQIRDRAEAEAERVGAELRAELEGLREESLKQGMEGGRRRTRTRSGPRRKHQELQARLRDMRVEANAKMDALVDRAFAVLSDSQKDIVTNFKPCFVPARDFRNPERVGQATDDTSFGEGLLARLRRTPAPRLAAAREQALERMVEYALHEYHIAYSDAIKAEFRKEFAERLDAAVARCRNMTDADFELEKADMARQLTALDCGNKDRYKSAAVVRWKVRQYILNPNLTPILEARAQGAGQ